MLFHDHELVFVNTSKYGYKAENLNNRALDLRFKIGVCLVVVGNNISNEDIMAFFSNSDKFLVVSVCILKLKNIKDSSSSSTPDLIEK